MLNKFLFKRLIVLVLIAVILAPSTDVLAATTYRISYNGNGGTNVPSSQTKTHGKTMTLTTKKPSRAGHTFVGWSTNSNSISAPYLAGGKYSLNKSITLYSVWKKLTYTINYNANGGSGAPKSQTKTYGTTLTLANSRPTRATHVFLGWSTNSKASTANYSANGKYTANSGATLYAIWRKAYTYSVKYNANGGTGTPASQTKTENVTLALQKNKPTRTGHTFIGWATKATATSANYSAGSSYTANSTTTLYAVWKKVTYTINYNTNGGSGAPKSQTKTYGTTLTLSNSRPTRANHVFLGWSTNSRASAANYSANGKYTANSGATLYAIWRKAYTYSVKYNANGGTGTPASQTKTENVTLALQKNKPTRTGHTFIGWATKATATSANYSAGASYTANSTVTLYAIWKKNTYTISYSANGGSGAPTSQTKTYGNTLKLSNTQPSRRGYVFLGWSTDSKATKQAYSAGGNFTINSKNTLYAVWEAQGGVWENTNTTLVACKEVYMPKKVAAEYYESMQKTTVPKIIGSAFIGSVSESKLTAALVSAGLSPFAAGIIAFTVVVGVPLHDHFDKKAFKRALDNCPKNGFVVIEYRRYNDQTPSTTIYKNATNVNSGGKWRANTYK